MEVKTLLLELVRNHVCADARIEGDDLVAAGSASIDGSSRSIALRIEASAMAASLRQHGEPAAPPELCSPMLRKNCTSLRWTPARR